MSLFKRIFPSLFPQHFGVSALGPVHVFLSLINPKHFFTVIVKRMVENPKLNLFDIGLDAIETKIGFGNEANIKPKDLDLYFSYCIAANLNGYKFYSITSSLGLISIALSQYFINDFSRSKDGTDQYMVLLITINIVGYMFAARVKVFPLDMELKESFNRFIVLFFNTYEYLLKLYSVVLTNDEHTSIKNTLMQHVDIFFCLYDIYNLQNTFLVTPHSSDIDQIQRLLKQEVKKKSAQVKLNEFLDSYQTYKYDSALYGFEDVLFDMIMPAEIMIKLLYNRQDVFLISEYLVPFVYKKQDLDLFIQRSLQRDPGVTREILEYIMDHKYRKESFFEAVKHMIMHHHSHTSLNTDILEDLFSSISDGSSGFVPLPNEMMKEGMLMDRMLNFYVGLMGTFWVGRGDSLYIRYMKPGLLDFSHALTLSNKTSIGYSNMLLHMWNKNAFFYRTIFDGVRSGKQSFIIPFVADVKEIYQHKYVLDQMMINAVSILYQDILAKDIRLSIHQPSLTYKMQKLHGKEVLSMIGSDTVHFLENYYRPIDKLLTKPFFSSTAIIECTDQDVKLLKDSLYSLEYRVVNDFLQLLHASAALGDFDDAIVVHIISILKDTLVGVLFLMHVILTKERLGLTSMFVDHLLAIFIRDILLITPPLIVDQIITSLHQLYHIYSPLIELWVKIDDNQYFIDVGVDCWSIFVNKKNDNSRSISIEDALRFRGYLKHITYYNKRYVVPKI